MQESEEIQTKLTEYFSQKTEIDTVILFGSFAKGKANSHSDIDVAVHSKTPLGYNELSSIQSDLALLCKREIDLADLSKAEGIFLYQIMYGFQKQMLFYCHSVNNESITTFSPCH